MACLQKILEFMGRKPRTSDLVGEKLTEKFVKQSLKNFAPFVLLPAGNRYVMLTNQDVSMQQVESALCAWTHYRLARELDLLQPVQIKVVGHITETCLITDLAWAQRLLAQVQRQAIERTIQPATVFQSPLRRF
jgi:hypothetical protein